MFEKEDVRIRSLQNDIKQLTQDMKEKDTKIRALDNYIQTVKNEDIKNLNTSIQTVKNEDIKNLNSSIQTVKNEDIKNLNTSIQTVKNEDIKNLNTSIQDSSVKVATCGYRENMGKNDNTITFDKVYVEVNDNGGYLNKETGRFTAGTAGIYEVTASIGQAYTHDKSSFWILLKTSSGRYQDDYENRFLHQLSDGDERDDAAMSASRFMFLDENEYIYLDYQCDLNKNCLVNRIKWCISFYSAKK